MRITVEFDADVELGIQEYITERQVSREDAINALLLRGLSVKLDESP